jgi:hypothetical protein
MDGHSGNLEESGSGPVVAGLGGPEELAADEVPDALVSEFSSLTTPYCWVIIEDAVAGYDGPGGPALAHQPRRSTGHASRTRSPSVRYRRSW